MRTTNSNTGLTATTLLAILLSGYLYAQSAEGSESSGREISQVNKSITIENDEQLGDVSSVNGDIDVGSGAVLGTLKTVNGSIVVGPDVTSSSAKTVNGSIKVGSNTRINGSLETVNGKITVAEGTQVADGLATVNGDITLTGSKVGKNVATVNGEISLQNGSVIEGDLIIGGKRRWWDRLFNSDMAEVVIEIDASSVVQGDIHLYKKADLRIHDSAKIGAIIEHF